MHPYDRLHIGLVRRVESLPRGKNSVVKLLRQLRRTGPQWDPWILKDGDVYRLFYLMGEEGLKHWWAESKVGAAISTDLKNWRDLGVALEPNPERDWESGRIFTGCTYKEDGVYYLFYSGAPSDESKILYESTGLAVSEDGVHWQRRTEPVFSNWEERFKWYDWCDWEGYPLQFSWRDPYVVKDAATGKYHMFICAYAKSENAQPFRGCVGLAIADRIEGPYEIQPPVAAPDPNAPSAWPFYMAERPQVIFRDGQYHLFFSCFTNFLDQRWVNQVGSNGITSSSLYWFVSDSLAGPYKPVSDKPVVEGSHKTGLYGTHFLPSPAQPDQLIAYGFYHKVHTLEVAPTFRVCWEKGSLAIKK